MQPAYLCDNNGSPIHQLSLLTLPAVIIYKQGGEHPTAWSRFQDNEYRQVSFTLVSDTEDPGYE